MTKQHTNSAAFRLYKYQCTKCHAVEHIWNSRDGYVPHNIMCGCCGSDSTKMEGEAAKYYAKLPSYALRVFVDVKEDEAKEYAAQQTEYAAQNGPEELRVYLQDEENAKQFFQERLDNIYGRGNRPHTIFRLEFLNRQREIIENAKESVPPAKTH